MDPNHRTTLQTPCFQTGPPSKPAGNPLPGLTVEWTGRKQQAVKNKNGDAVDERHAAN